MLCIPNREFMTVQRDVQRQITNRTTRAKKRTGKDDEGLVGLRKILKELIEKRNRENKEKASNTRASYSQDPNKSRDHVATKSKYLTVTKPTLIRQNGQT